jgi:HEAT repeat protein
MLRISILVLGLLSVGRVAAADDVDDLIAQLGDKSPDVRRKAAGKLGMMVREDRRLDPLEKLVTGDPDPKVRLEAFAALRPGLIGIGTAPRWKKLRVKVLLNDADVAMRRSAANDLRPAEPDTFDAQLAALKKETDDQVLSTLALSLGDAKAPGLADALLAAVERGVTTGDVLSSLGRTKDPRAVDALAAAARRGVGGAINALIWTGDPKVADVLVELLPAATGDNVDFVVDGLSKFPDARAVPDLLKTWTKLSKADKKRSMRPYNIDMGEDSDQMPFSLQEALREIAAIDPAPCAAAKTAKGDLKKYLKKILPKKCGAGAAK